MKCDFIRTRTIKDSLYHNKVLMVNVKIDYPSLASNYSGNSMRFNMHYRQKAHRNYRYASIAVSGSCKTIQCLSFSGISLPWL